MGIGAAISSFFAGLLRLAGPAFLLAVCYGVALVTRMSPITALDPFIEGAPSSWLTQAHLVIMLAFFINMLNNRAHGPAIAFVQLVVTWLVIGAGVFYLGHHPGFGFVPPAILSDHKALCFVGALFGAHLLNIILFDAMRGKPWWRAPLVGGLIAAIALPAIYWSLTRAADTPWLTKMTLDIGLKAITSLVLLVPFAMLRGTMRPRNGFGGY